jgi:hypothetical protein
MTLKTPHVAHCEKGIEMRRNTNKQISWLRMSQNPLLYPRLRAVISTSHFMLNERTWNPWWHNKSVCHYSCILCSLSLIKHSISVRNVAFRTDGSPSRGYSMWRNLIHQGETEPIGGPGSVLARVAWAKLLHLVWPPRFDPFWFDSGESVAARNWHNIYKAYRELTFLFPKLAASILAVIFTARYWPVIG